MLQRIIALGLVVISWSAPAQVEGRFGQALLAGENYAAAPPNPVYTVMPLTVECWAKLTSKSAYNMLAANEPKNSVTHWEIYADKNTGNFAAFLPAYSQPIITSKTDIVDGKWHYLALTCDGQTAKLYVDAKEVVSAKVTKKFSYPDVGPLTFGHIEGVDTTKDAVIDEVRISRVIRAIEKTPDAPFAADADTVGLWHFDGDGKSGYADVSTTKNAVKLVPRDAAKPQAADINPWARMDTGPFFTSTLVAPALKGNVAYKGISVRLAKGKSAAASEAAAAICFDTETMRVFAGWTDGFVKIYPAREGLAQPMDVAGKLAFWTPMGPGWARGESFDDPRPDKLGPLPPEWARYHGLYLNGDRVIFSYSVGKTEILESWDYETVNGVPMFAQTIELPPTKESLQLRIAELTLDAQFEGSDSNGGKKRAAFSMAVIKGEFEWAVAARGDIEGLKTGIRGGGNGWTYLIIEPSNQPRHLKLLRWTGLLKDSQIFQAAAEGSAQPIDLGALTKGGPLRWGEPLNTKGKLGDASISNPKSQISDAYVVDTLTPPEKNPFNSYLRFSGHDFFKNGDMAICSISGDVWTVSGIDEKLDHLTWRRFATGLHQPLGLKILPHPKPTPGQSAGSTRDQSAAPDATANDHPDEDIYVLGRDQITRLHDLNHDGEADFYENFNNGCKVTTNGHGYATNLETDPEGNFYYLKCADNTNFGGTVIKVSADGKYCEPFAFGLRNPNGLGISPSGFITEADNQGEWVPASRIDFVEPGKFLGYKPSAHDAPAKDMGKPICFMPQNIDNSSGGQVWAPADSDQWGPFKGDMLHTSYGGARLLHVMMEKVGDTWQGGVTAFPLKFDSGIMRGRFNPKDGQLYVSGLRGWQTAGLRSGAIQRVRYTGKPVYMPKALHTHANGVSITFPVELDRASATDAENYSVLRWTYKWTGDYPSRHFSVKDPKKQGYDTVDVKSASLSKDGKTIFLEIPDIAPVLQQQITLNIKAADGHDVHADVYQTIHNLGPAYSP